MKVDNYLFEDIYNVGGDKAKIEALNFRGVSYSFEEIRKSVDYFAHELDKKGVKKGDHVAILALNSVNWLISFYAIIKVGAIAVLINYLARHDTLVDLIKYTDCNYICYGSYRSLTKDKDDLDKLLKETNIKQENAISIKDEDLNLKDILATQEITPFVSPYSREEDSKRTSFIIFTTGTTAKPKAAMLSQFSQMNIIYLNFARLDSVFPQKFMCLLPCSIVLVYLL